MAIGANVALVAAGCYIRLLNHALSSALGGDTQLLSLRVLIGTVMAMTGLMFASKAFIDERILQPAAAAAAAAAGSNGAAPVAAAGGKGGSGGSGSSGSGAKKGGGKKKAKGTFSEGLEVLRSSPKIRNLALLVMSYGVGHRCACVCVFVCALLCAWRCAVWLLAGAGCVVL
jgi:AAA family ATP:ADP antiporter